MHKFMRKGSKILAFFVALIMTSFVCIDASFFTIEASAQTVYSADDIVEDMGLGWNLGNSLDATGDGGANGQETSWGNPWVTEDLIKAVKAKGFNTVRVPVSWYKNITVENGKYTINADWFARVKEVVDYAYNNGMYVILNIHHEDWINRADLASSYSVMSTELKQVWTQIAEYFADYDQHLIFEGMNEPRMEGAKEDEWTGNSACYEVINKLDADFISTVRSVDSAYKNTRLLMVPGYAASGDYGIYSNLDKSLFNDPYVAASVHAYKPYSFAMGDGDHSSFSSDYKAELDSVFNDLRSFFTQDGIPVVIGEFSTSNYGYTNARVDWAEYYMTLAKEIGIACVLWDNNVEKENGGEAHGYINRINNTWYSVSEPVVDKLISVRNDSSIVWASKSAYPMYAHKDYSSGTAVTIGNSSDSAGNIIVSGLKGFVSGKELAVKFSSQTAPKFALMNADWGGWTELSAYDYSYSNLGNIAYLRYDDIYSAWDSSANGDIYVIKINNYDDISFISAVMLDVSTSEAHKHTLEKKYSSDATGHWHKCTTCDEKVNFKAHTSDNGTVTKQPTETTEGEKTYKCTVCGYVIRTEVIAKLDHKHVLDTNWSSDATGHWHNCTGCSEKVDFAAHTEDNGTVTKQPTMTEEGEKTYKCKVCEYVIRTEAVPKLSDSAVAVYDGTETKTFDDLDTALKAYKTTTKALTITLNKDANVKTLSLPTKAESITFTGTGTLNVSGTSITVPANTTFDVEVNGKGKTLAVRVSKDKTLSINKATSNIGAVSGTRTSILNVNEDTEALSIATFGAVNVEDGKTLTVTSRLSAVTSLNGAVKLPTSKTTAAAVTAGNAEIILTDGNIAKVTLADVTNKLNVKVVNENNETVDLSSGTIVLYSTKDISEKTTIENTTADQKELNAFYYKKNRAIKAEWADAITLSYSNTDRKFPNMELALESITDKNTDYTITLNTDITASTFALPAAARSVTIKSENEAKTITLTNITAVSAKTPLTFENIKLESTKPYTISTTSDLTLDRFASDSITAVRGGAKATLTLGETTPIDKVSGFGTTKVTSEFRTGTMFTTTDLELAETANLVVSNTKAPATAKTLNGAEGSVITLDAGFTPIKVTGTTADSISGTIKLKAAEAIDENTVLFTTKYAGNNVFDVTEIQPQTELDYTVTSISGKAYMKPIVFEMNDTGYALWTDVMTVIENVKMSEAQYTVKLLDDADINGAMKLPKAGTYGKLTISSESKTLTFTGSITATGELEIANTNLVSARNTTSSKYTISAGKYQFAAENADLSLASITSTADVTLKNTRTSGTVRAGKLTLNGTNTILGTITASELGSTEEGTVLNILSNTRGVMSITKNGITENSEEITIKLVDESENAVTAENLSIIASSFTGNYSGELKLSTENGEFSIILSRNKLVLADSFTAANGLLEVDEEESDDTDTSEEEPAEETPEDNSDDAPSEEDAPNDEDTSDNDINEETESSDMTEELSA